MPYHECNQFNICSANRCPLGPLILERDFIKNEGKCISRKSSRVKIGSKYPDILKYQGLRTREWQGKQLSSKILAYSASVT